MDKFQRQLELEEKAVELGIKRYYNKTMEWSLGSPKGHPESRTKPGKLLLKQFLQPLSSHIETWKTNVSKGKAGRQALQLKVLQKLDSDHLAMHTLSSVIDGLKQREGENERIQKIASKIVEAITTDINFNRLMEDQLRLEFILLDTFKKESSKYKKDKLLKKQTDWFGTKRIYIDPSDKIRIGVLLISLAQESTGLFTVETERPTYNNSRKILRATPIVEDWFRQTHKACAVLSPIKMPMIHPPKPWTDLNNGGFLSPKLQRPMVHAYNANYMEELSHEEMPQVYKAINAIQATAWRINKPVYEVMKEVWETCRTAGGLPTRELELLPAKPHDIDTNEDARKDWKRRAAEVHDNNARLTSSRLSISQKLWLAEKFKKEEAIYYPHHLDWRGRIYPSAGLSNMTPQGDDTGKALLEFAKGKKLGKSGSGWLAVHLANLFGKDKLPFDERVKWVNENESNIRNSAEDPLEFQFWAGADKPYQALAACIEWKEFLDVGDDFVTHLPIALDGTNNGAQHLSAMGRDGRATVNLSPCSAPQDVYQVVADKVSRIVRKDALEGNEYALLWDGKINRKITKRPVMTLCYGVTVNGMANQIMDELRTATDIGKPICEYKQIRAMGYYLAKIIYPKIGEVLISAMDIMKWLKHATKLVTKEDMPIWWITPSGLPVMQNYRNRETKRIRSTMAGIAIELSVAASSDRLDKTGQSKGIAPNFVHSLDSSHLMLSVNAMVNAGMDSFAMIHDSYGCHACDVDMMSRIIREEFVKMYSHDFLQDFREKILAGLLEKNKVKLNNIPEKGELDINQVMHSEYFFS